MQGTRDKKICMKKLLTIVCGLSISLSGHARQGDVEFGVVEADTLSLDVVDTRTILPYDYSPDFTYEMVEERLAGLNSGVPIQLNERVFSFIDYFTVRNRDYIRSVQQRAEVYFPIFEKYLKEYDLPEELKYLSIVESGLRTNAISRVGAGGLWQFMPATGRFYKLHQDWYIDERMDPEKATEAACKYLKQLYGMFGDWDLALAAYNSGPGNVRKAIRRSGYKKTFWEVYRYLPRETRSYVPQFVAILYTMNFNEFHNLYPDEKEYMMAYDTVMIDQYLHIETFANLTGLCADDILKLNPHLIRGVIPETVSNYPLRVPSDKMDFVYENMDFLLDSAGKVGKEHLEKLAQNMPGSTYGRENVRYRVQSGDVLGTIAQRYHVRVSDLREWNRISGNMIRVGQTLNIWVLPNYQSKPNLYTPSSTIAKVPTQSTVISASVGADGSKYHMVQSGDTLWDISKKYGNVSIEKIKQLNNLSSSKIHVGQKLLIE